VKKSLLFSLQDRPTVLVSACLLGKKCRYDGKKTVNPSLLFYKDLINFIPFCPEQLGGLPTPRPASNIFGGDGMDVIMGKAKVINVEGKDVTENFKLGAYKSLELALRYNPILSIMRKKSPSCGIQTPYCEAKNGMGVTAALFKLYKIKMIECAPNDLLIYTGAFLMLLNPSQV